MRRLEGRAFLCFLIKMARVTQQETGPKKSVKKSFKPVPKKRGRPTNVTENKQSKTWDFTDYRVHSENEKHDSTRLDWWKSLEFSFLRIAGETCPETQNKHGQGRITFRRNYRFEALKKILPPDVSFQATKADIDFNYGRKWDSSEIVEIDNRQRGRRSIFPQQRDAIRTGSSLVECIDMEGANMQSVRTAELLMKYLEPPRPTAPRQIIMTTSDQVPDDVYRLADKRFWDGYDANKSVCIRQSVCKLTKAELRQLCDPKPFRLAGGRRQAKFDVVYITNISTEDRQFMERCLS